MPDLFPVINNNLLTGLTDSYSLQLTPKAPQWWVSDTIAPVALVSSNVTLTALLSRSAESAATEGVKSAGGVATLLADTGSLSAGTYYFRIYMDKQDATSIEIVNIQHRDAANAANVLEYPMIFALNPEGQHVTREFTFTLAESERMRVITAGAFAGSQFAMILFHILT